ncbi:hypothetical protein [Streptomyces sp. NPDC059631]|uniref:hypothetical protein n=1 Tax=unclassified Streptomyces TaxID=2593676 RepID=UPI0036888D3A
MSRDWTLTAEPDLVAEHEADLDVAALWAAAEEAVPRTASAGAVAVVEALVSEDAGSGEAATCEELARSFLSLLGESDALGAAPAGRPILRAVCRLPALFPAPGQGLAAVAPRGPARDLHPAPASSHRSAICRHAPSSLRVSRARCSSASSVRDRPTSAFARIASHRDPSSSRARGPAHRLKGTATAAPGGTTPRTRRGQPCPAAARHL